MYFAERARSVSVCLSVSVSVSVSVALHCTAVICSRWSDFSRPDDDKMLLSHDQSRFIFFIFCSLLLSLSLSLFFYFVPFSLLSESLTPMLLNSPPPLTVYESGTEPPGHEFDRLDNLDSKFEDDSASVDERVMSQLLGRMHTKQVREEKKCQKHSRLPFAPALTKPMPELASENVVSCAACFFKVCVCVCVFSLMTFLSFVSHKRKRVLWTRAYRHTV
jgi:hypothetical protein